MPGTQLLSTAGLTGNTGSAIVRGLPSAYQQLVVDGVRISGDTNGIGNFLANGQLGNVTRVEVLRGPQSVLYGTGAGGGVIGFETSVGESDPTVRLFGEGGSFDSHHFGMSATGRVGIFPTVLSPGRFFTSNDTYQRLPIHDYEQSYANLALQWQLRDDFRVKFPTGDRQFFEDTLTGSFWSPERRKSKPRPRCSL